jgi:hypothetical protein
LPFDHKFFASEMAGMVKEYTARAMAPVLTRMDAIEQRLGSLPVPKDADPAEVAGIVFLSLEKRLSEVDARMEALPAPKVTPEELAPLIAESVSKAVSALPRAKDGEPGLAGPAGPAGAAGRDGINIAGVMIDRQGELVVTLSNGEQKSLGCVIGRDGTDGAPGKDGADGFGFEDIDCSYDGDRKLLLSFALGDRTKQFEFDLPIIVYRGVYKSGEAYKAGDSVTWGGSLWIARKDTAAEPETKEANNDWQLGAKRGREGKPGKNGKDGKDGAEGKPGRDLTQLGQDGGKW